MPNPKVRRTIDLPYDLAEKLEQRAKQNETTAIDLIRRALEKYLEEDEG
jgi:predicted DNA-binding protein